MFNAFQGYYHLFHISAYSPNINIHLPGMDEALLIIQEMELF